MIPTDEYGNPEGSLAWASAQLRDAALLLFWQIAREVRAHVLRQHDGWACSWPQARPMTAGDYLFRFAVTYLLLLGLVVAVAGLA